MSVYIDKIILYLMGAWLIYTEINIPYDIVFLLFGIIVFGITCYLDNSENYLGAKIAYVLLSLAGFAYVRMIPFVPIVAYSVAYKINKQYRFSVPYLIGLTGLIVRFSYVNSGDYSSIIWLTGLCVFAILMGYKTHIIGKQDTDIKKMRDDSTEKNNYLSEKNRILASNMDNEVRIATLSERNRIAREIHDNVGHMLSRSILQLGAVMTVNKNEKVYEQLIPLKESLDTAMNNVRESVHDLHKDSFDIKQAAQGILDELTDFNVKFTCDMSAGASKEIKYSFVTILKEAVTNIEKYCKGDKVTVVISELEEYYQMLIEDNGIVEKNRFHIKAGIGLSNMEERVKSLGGIITFSTESGFRIFISVPKKVVKNENSNSR